MEILLDDYKPRLKSVTEFIEKTHSNGSIVHQRREERLNTKAAEYRTFIVEIERAMARRSNENSGLNIPVVSFNEACECDNTEVCGICFRKKGYEMIDNKLTLTGEMEVCDKCDEQFTYAGDYRNICFKCEHDYI